MMYREDHMDRLKLAADQHTKEKEYWMQRLADWEEKSWFPYDHKKEETGKASFQELKIEFNPGITSGLIKLSSGSDQTLHIILAAGVTGLLARYTGNPDIIIGTPVYEPQIETEFINTILILRNQLKTRMTFKELLLDVRQSVLEASENQNFPVEILIEKLGLKSASIGFPLFDVIVLWDNLHNPKHIEHIPINMVFSFKRESREITGKVTYNSLLYEKQTIERIIGHLINYLQVSLFNLLQPIAEIDFLSKEERNQVLYDFNHTGAQYPSNKTIHTIFAEQVEKLPHNTSLILPGGREQLQLTYGKLNQKANGLAKVLRKLGTASDKILGIILEPSVEMIAAILGILKAGGAYLPIDPGHPRERIKYILNDSSPDLVLSNKQLKGKIEPGAKVIDCDDQSILDETGNLPDINCPDDAAYIIYTSGTTGKPKGVMVNHKNVIRLLFNDKFQFDFKSSDVWTMFHSYNFDFSVWEMYGALLYGGKLIPIPKVTARDPGKFLGILEKENVTILNQVPTAFYQLAAEALGRGGQEKSGNGSGLHLRYIIFGGEALKPVLLKEWQAKYPATMLINMFGITETTVHVTYKEIGKVEIMHNSSNIGKPLPTTTVFVLDKHLKLLPVGVPGQLCVGGMGVARGYLNRPELTAEKFDQDLWDYQDYHDEKEPFGQIINTFGEGEAHELNELARINEKFLQGEPDQLVSESVGRWVSSMTGSRGNESLIMAPHQQPETKENQHKRFAQHKGSPRRGAPGRRRQKIYKTGDLVKMTNDGEMIYIGRIDHQVQVRGFRVEPREIECKILQRNEIKEAIVTAGENENGDSYLCAYVVTGNHQKLQPGKLRKYLSKELPGYMIPNYFVLLERIPLTANGKVDRKRLPAPGIKPGQTVSLPRSRIEKQMVGIWRQVLGVEQVGVGDNYFQLGGDSIKAIRLIHAINSQLNTTLPMADLYQHQTIEELADHLNRQKQKMIKNLAIEDALAHIEAFKAQVLKNHRFPPQLEIEEIYPMSDTEKGIAFYYLRDFATGVYHNQVVYQQTFKDFSPRRMKQALVLLIQKHPILRTGYLVEESAHIVYKSSKSFEAIEYKDISALGKKEQEQLITRYARQNREKPFNLLEPPLWRLVFFKIGPQSTAIFWQYYHGIIDGWSNATFFTELNNTYHRLKQEPGFSPEALKSGYKEFIIDQIVERKNPAALDYWKSELQGYKRWLFPGTVQGAGTGEIKSFTAEPDPQLVEALKSLAGQCGITCNHLCFAAYLYMLNMFSYENDITTGVVTHIRPLCQDGDKILGCFLNIVPFRVQVPPGIKWRDWIELVDKKMHRLKRYEKLSFLEILNVLEEKSQERHPVYDTVFNFIDFHIYHNMEHKEEQWEVEAKLELEAHEKTNYPLGISINAFGNSFLYQGEYATAFISDKDMNRFYVCFTAVLEQFIKNIDGMIDKSRLIPLEEKKKLLEVFNGGSCQLSLDKSIHGLFEEQAGRTPDNIAVKGPGLGLLPGSKNNLSLSYRYLNEESNRLAHLLKKKGIHANSVAALMAERSVEMIVGILGILKAGAAYLPIDPEYPGQRILTMLNQGRTDLILTQGKFIYSLPVTSLKNMNTFSGKKDEKTTVTVTPPQQQIRDFDQLPITDRTLVDYEKYHRYVGIARARNTISLQATRGCPYNCLYCHKIWPKKHIMRSADHILQEIRSCYEAGVRRFSFVDDIFNLHERNSGEFLRKIINNGLKVQLYFPNGLRGDILTKDFIDLMIEAGTIEICLALETASPRLQKLLQKNLNLEKFQENVHYIANTYPQVVLDMELMLGFPTETEEEALQTLEMLKSFKWIHFPDLNILKIFPNTDMYWFAIENGVSKEAIEKSTKLAYQDLPETLPFSKNFARQYQARYMSEYFLLKERLLDVLPVQMTAATEDELVQKYDSYLPLEIKSFSDILHFAAISKEDLGKAELKQEGYMEAPGFNKKIRRFFPREEKENNAFKILLLDLSLQFSKDSNIFYDMIEEPLGLMALLTYLDKRFKHRVQGKIAKSRIDFDSHEELKALICDFKPGLIGIRTLSYYKEFFHQTVLLIRQWGFEGTIVTGGPYATSDYQFLLQDTNVNLAVLGEGELTLGQLVEKMMENNNKLPDEETLTTIHGIAFIKNKDKMVKPGKEMREILFLEELSISHPQTNPIERPLQVPKDQPAPLLYVLYTSGSTGIPKGVLLEHGNLANLIRHQYNHTEIDFSCVLQFTTITFDVSAQEIFSTLLAGGKLILVSKEIITDIPRLCGMVERNHIKTVFLPASFLNFVINEPGYTRLIPGGLRHVVTAGEQVIVNEHFRKYLQENRVYLHNHYGPSETHVVTALTLKPGEDIPTLPSIGRPVSNTGIYILDKTLQLVPLGVPGEIFIAGIQVGRGYLNNPELTAEKFKRAVISQSSLVIGSSKSSSKTNDQCLTSNDRSQFHNDQWPVTNDRSINDRSHPHHPHLSTTPPLHHSPIYRTGDLARWLGDGNIEFLGRIDHQVKIRGFRIELGEIESRLLQYDEIKEAVVVTGEDNKGDKYLCAYIVSDGKPQTSELREYLALVLPDYMIPSFFVQLEKIPLTPNGKVDRKALPAARLKSTINYIVPQNITEETMLEIWAEVLSLEKEKINIETNFFELGGHSINATVMIEKIHKEFQVKLPLAQVFKTPTIVSLSAIIKDIKKERYASIELLEKKEYYVLSSAQKRLYLLQGMELTGTAYNISMTLSLEGELNSKALENTFRQLIKRHESLRTSFHMINEKPIQRICEKVEFKIEYYQVEVEVKVEEERSSILEGTGGLAPLPVEPANAFSSNPQSAAALISSFIRPFDLSNAPLLRVGLICLHTKPSGHPSQEGNTRDKHILIIDMHHIITDGISMVSFVKESMALYAGEELPPLKLQYKDYSQWQNSEPQKKVIKEQEKYWLKQFEGEVPVLNLPLDYTRPAVQSFEGALLSFEIPVETTRALNQLALHTGATLYMVLLAIYNILLSKLTGQEDIVVGTPIAARRHVHLERIIGMFVNILAMRNYPEGNKKFIDFLLELKENILEAFENQEYQFEDLVEKVLSHRDIDRNPLFDTLFGLQNIEGLSNEIPAVDIYPLIIKPFPLEMQISKFDLSLSCEEHEETVFCTFEYCTKLFKKETIRRIVTYFMQVVLRVSADRHEKISRIEIISETEKNQVLYDFNNTITPFPKDKTLCQLFEEQAVRNPNQEVVTFIRDLSPLYEELHAEKTNPGLIQDLEKCCFKRNPYIFQYPGQQIIDTIDIFAGPEKEELIMLRTHKQDFAAVNTRVFSLLGYFDGSANVKSMLSGMGKTPGEFVIHEIRKDEYSDFAPGMVHRVIIDGTIEEMIRLIKVMYRCHLIELAGWSTASKPLIIQPGQFELTGSPGEKPPVIDKNGMKGIQGNHRSTGYSVLLLGDRTGTATTGILYIASYLRRNGITAYCQWNDMNNTTASLKKNIERILKTLQPPVKILGVSMKWFPHIARVLEICKTVKEFDPSIKVVVGGNTASYYPEEIIRYECIDYVVRGDGEVPFLKICMAEEDIPNCLGKKNGKIIETPITYIQDEKNSKEIYLSHLEEIFVSEKDLYLAPYFYIYTGKGCNMQCFYCGGCRDAQKKIFNRDKPFLRGIEEARRDILETMKYTSTFLFDFDLPLSYTFEYYQQLWQSIDLSGHFCEFYSWKLPAKEFIAAAARIFKYVYINIDLCSLSQEHRLKLSSLGLVKPQPTDEELFSFFDNCETYPNVEVIINHITGLPYFSAEDIRISKDVLANLVKNYSTLGGMDWGRLHAQPGAPLTKTYKNYDMKNYGETFEEFLNHSKRNLQEAQYPELETYHYPYIYFNDEHLNSLVTRYYLEMDEKIKRYQKVRRKLHMVNTGITYRQLQEKSNCLTRGLMGRGVKPGIIVGLMANQSIEMAIGMLAILEAGGAYMPIDPVYPEERIKYMLEDSNTGILLTEANLFDRFENPRVVFTGDMIDIMAENNYPGNKVKIESGLAPGSPAYVMYTSGSTGRPKGVMISHRNVIRLVKNSNYIDFPPGSRLLMTGSIAFDITTFEIWAPLINGWHLYLAGGSTTSIITDAEKLNRVIKSNRISILHLIPQLFNQLAAETLDIFALLRYFLVGGDLVKPWNINRLKEKYPRLKILHMYGPTENTTFSTYLSIERAYENTIPIGKPVSNTFVYILGKGDELLPPGAVGELVIGGEGTARGYLNQPELTAEKFEQDLLDYQDYHDEKNQKFLRRGSGGAVFSKSAPPGRRRLYKTGDLARWLPDGNIEFLGRIDNQVKLRGMRIELGEIERRLLAHPGIKEVLVQMLPGGAGSGDKELCAYITADKEISVSEIRESLAKSLPGHMIPSYFVFLERIPLTSNGKVDRKGLPLPDVKTGAVYAAPRNEIEKKLTSIWIEVLGRDAQQVSQLETSLGIDDNFFELGGHSLKAAGVISRVNNEFEVNVPLVELFKNPYIRKLAEYIQQAVFKSVNAPSKDNQDNNLVLLKENPGSAGNLFFLHDGSGEVEGYIELCVQLEGGYNYWGIRAHRLDNYTPRNLSIKDAAAGYIEKIKALQPGGPYYITGWSLGGLIAFEIALQLEQRGEAISFLGLIDAPPPTNDKERREELGWESEIQWIKEYLPDEKIKEKLGQVTQIHEIWPTIVNHLEENNFDIEIIKQLIPGPLAQIIPNYDRLTIRELIYYLNIDRTLTRAQAFYIPSKKVHTLLHYFKASESPTVFRDRWQDYCIKPIKSFEIPGDHFSILKIPDVYHMIKIFDKILKKIV